MLFDKTSSTGKHGFAASDPNIAALARFHQGFPLDAASR
jgi:hypothetical protein